MNKQGMETLRAIKSMMREAHSNVKYIQAEEKALRKEQAQRMKEYLEGMDGYWRIREKERLERIFAEEIDALYSNWDAEDSYYLIYKDGSCVCTSDAELISGEKLPKLTDIVYAMYSGTCDSWDTESGELHWYEGDEVDYEAEDERKEAYENAIEIKYGTEFGKRLVARGYGVA